MVGEKRGQQIMGHDFRRLPSSLAINH